MNKILDEKFDVDVKINPWSHNSGATVHLDLINLGENEIPDVAVKFKSDFQIRDKAKDLWGAKIVSQTAKNGKYEYVLNLNNNPDLEPGEKHSFGFNTLDSTPEFEYISLNGTTANEKPPVEESTIDIINISKPEPVLEADTLSVEELTVDNAEFDFTLVNDWENSFEGQISITNNTGGNIDTWSLEFDFPHQIKNIWDAEIENNDDGKYVITHAPWNREIAAGETVTFDFHGNGSFTSEPEKFQLTGSIFNSPSISETIYTSSNPDLSPELNFQNYQGRATFYNLLAFNNGKGNSGYDLPAPHQREKVTAINSVQWNGSEASGAFLEVSGPKQRDGAEPIIVQVIDQLPERADGLDLSSEAFPKIAEPSDGVVNIDYKLVGPPDDYLTAYGYKIGQGIVVEGISETSPDYAAVRLNNHRYPIESIDLITDGGNQIALERESDNRFVLNGNYPLYGAQDLLVTDIFGQQLTLDDVNITNGSSADIITGQQFDLL